MIKKLFAVLLALVMLIGVLPMAAMADETTKCEDGCVLGDGELVTTKEPTCVKKGEKRYAFHCINCGDFLKYGTERFVIEAVGHAWADATCTAPKTCTVCGETEGESNGHNKPEKPSRTEVEFEATCTKEGRKINYYDCTVCGKQLTFVREAIPVVGHDWNEATCTAPKTCAVCGETEGESNGHNKPEKPSRTEVEFEATCTKEGRKINYYDCTVCGKQLTFVREAIPVKSHTYVDGKCECGAIDPETPVEEACDHNVDKKVKDATCTAEGLVVEFCTKCGETLKEETIPTVDHEKKDKSYAPTCTEDGLNHVVCTTCDQVLLNEVVEKTGHKWEDGVCSVCGAESPFETAPKCEHEKLEKTEPATCTKDGIYHVVCTKCNELLLEEVIPATGHEKLEKREEATCTQDGIYHVVCTKCNELLLEEITPALGHEKLEKIEPATCTKEGLRHVVCTKCDELLEEEILPVADHVKLDKSRPATCKKNGRNYVICTECDQVLLNEVVRATGHNWQKATCENPMTCKDCGKTVGRPLHHSWKKATCESPKTCRHCGKTVGHALKHDWAEATCKSPKTCKDCGKTVGTAHKPVDHNRNGRCDKCNIRTNNFFHKHHYNKHFFNKFWKNHK